MVYVIVVTPWFTVKHARPELRSDDVSEPLLTEMLLIATVGVADSLTTIGIALPFGSTTGMLPDRAEQVPGVRSADPVMVVPLTV